MTKYPIISIILPTRGRPKHLQNAMSSLFDNADHPESLEFLLAIDKNDTGTIEASRGIRKKYGPAIVRRSIKRRSRYSNMFRRANYLSKLSVGNWILLWNDDAVMRSKSWDSLIRSVTEEVAIINFCSEDPEGSIVFPIITRKVLEIVGVLSRIPFCDDYLHDLGTESGILRGVGPVDFKHYHREFNDDTQFQVDKQYQYIKARLKENRETNRNVLTEDVNKIKEYLEKS